MNAAANGPASAPQPASLTWAPAVAEDEAVSSDEDLPSPRQPLRSPGDRTEQLGATRRPIQFSEKRGYNGKPFRVFSLEEVRRHNTPEDCWLIAHGRVYDVTLFLRRHPAGDRSILRHAGTDSTVDFDFHPMHAQKMWAPFMLGYLEGHESICTIS